MNNVLYSRLKIEIKQKINNHTEHKNVNNRQSYCLGKYIIKTNSNILLSKIVFMKGSKSNYCGYSMNYTR